ncbi:von Willebrand factor type A domain protein [Planctomycetes bacterium Pan216]|uniref:von Willebrand factor type A domain protein n=1 Tax=Kolteria novifilia TaxID=2527975 RepID=A0A518B2U7_9BACT|nr:von Willebrand factor type A domain protein [Planctomycetes bacterium Pan216]
MRRSSIPTHTDRGTSQHERRGIILVLSAIALVGILGMVAFAVDIGLIRLEQGRMQNAVDAAALAATQEIRNGVVNAQAGSVEDANSLAVTAAKNVAVDVAQRNGIFVDPTTDIQFGRRSLDDAGNLTTDWANGPFNVVRVTARRDNADLAAQDGRLPLAFARVLGYDSVAIQSSATAFLEARDIVLVLDYSGSMNDDSTFAAVNRLGLSSVEDNLDEIWEAMVDADGAFTNDRVKFPDVVSDGSKTFGDMTVGEGKYVSGYTASVDVLTMLAAYSDNGTRSLNRIVDDIRDFSVNSKSRRTTFMNDYKSRLSEMTNAEVVDAIETLMENNSKNDIKEAVRDFSNGSTDRRNKFEIAALGSPLTAAEVESLITAHEGTSDRYNRLLGAYEGVNDSNAVATSIANHLGLLDVDVNGNPINPYPQAGMNTTWTNGQIESFDSEKSMPSGPSNGDVVGGRNRDLWRNYIKWSRSDGSTNNAGYRNKYGTRTLMNYMLSSQPRHDQSEGIWNAPAYPFHAMKEGVTLFLDFLDDLDFGDYVGIVSYAENDARVESKISGEEVITDDYDALDAIQVERQAAYYSNFTGIGDGIRRARLLLEAKQRYGSRPVIMVLTDGQANRKGENEDGETFSSDDVWWNWREVTQGYNEDNPSSYYSTGDENRQYAMYEAMICVSKGITVHTMSVGAFADRNFMDALAFMGGGIHISVAGGASIASMEAEMLEAFRQVAANVPPGQLTIDVAPSGP